MERKQLIILLVAVFAAFVCWLLPAKALGLPDLTCTEQRMIGIFCYAAIMWISAAMPIWITSVVTVGAMLLMVSDSCLIFLRSGDAEVVGQLVSYQDIMASFADPVVMLFIGGFSLALAAQSIGLDQFIARRFLRVFGTKVETLMLGCMAVTAAMSMFMSNTATAAVMLPIVMPLLGAMPNASNERVAMTLGVVFAANIGGLGTPIGTPPNLLALKYINEIVPESAQMGFSEWVFFMVPLVLLLIFVTWIILITLFRFTIRRITVTSQEQEVIDRKSALIVVVTFCVTVALWILSPMLGLNAYVVGFVPLCVFCATGLFGKKELHKINWDLLWLVAGGFALGTGINDTGLAQTFVNSLHFTQWHPLMMIVVSGLLCYAMSLFVSNSAVAALFIPILASVAKQSSTVRFFGCEPALIIGISLAASLAMALPVSTPPNALAYDTGLVSQKQMALAGVIVGVVGLAIGYVMLFYIGAAGLV